MRFEFMSNNRLTQAGVPTLSLWRAVQMPANIYRQRLAGKVGRQTDNHDTLIVKLVLM